MVIRTRDWGQLWLPLIRNTTQLKKEARHGQQKTGCVSHEVLRSERLFRDTDGAPGRDGSPRRVHKRRQDIEKLVLYFVGQKSGLVVGPVVWDQIADVVAADGVSKFDSDDFTKWPSHWFELYRDKTPFGGKMVDCIRVRKPKALPSKVKRKPKPDPKSDPDDPVDL